MILATSRRAGFAATAFFVLAGALGAAPARAHTDSAPTKVVVTTPSTLSAPARSALEAASGGRIVSTISATQLVLRTAADDLGRLRAAASRIAPGSTVELDGRAHAFDLPNDPCLKRCIVNWGSGTSDNAPNEQWAIKHVHAPEAWRQTTGSKSVTVAIVDSGVNAAVPELAGKVIREIDEIPGVPRDTNHGTAVASIIAANTDNGVGIAGMSWKSRILSVRVADNYGSVSTSDLARGIRDAADAGAKIINVSIGGPDQSFVRDAVDYAESKGALVVAAAGNVHDTFAFFPAGYPNVLSVSAVDEGHDNFNFNYGPTVDVFAPGDYVLGVTANGMVTVISGTSFAAPIASGAAALIKAKYRNATPEAIRAMITTQARKVVGRQTRVRVPLLDVNAALSAKGYWLAARDGAVRNEGSAPEYGHPNELSQPIVGIAAIPGGKGYWLVARDGGIFSFGDARFFGSTGAIRLNQPIVGMAATPGGKGYWLVARDGGIFSFGDARFFGSTGAIRLNRPIVGMAATPDGKGYWLVARDGGIFSFGDARFFGSTGAMALKPSIVGMAATQSGHGYSLVGADGGVFAFGDAPYLGSGAGSVPDQSAAGITRNASGHGYWIFTTGGRVLPFGDARQLGEPPMTGRAYVGLAPSE